MQTDYSAQEFSRMITMVKNGSSVCVERYHWVQEACGGEKDNCMCAKDIKDGKLHQEKATVSYYGIIWISQESDVYRELPPAAKCIYIPSG